MATHPSLRAWRIPWTEEPGGLPGYSPWGRKESDTTEQLMLSIRCTHLKLLPSPRISLRCFPDSVGEHFESCGESKAREERSPRSPATTGSATRIGLPTPHPRLLNCAPRVTDPDFLKRVHTTNTITEVSASMCISHDFEKC